jgi:AcrR family transcriptional regulator
VLSDEMIGEAAFAIADKEGLHSVSVKRLAGKLNVPVARLETYLASRDDLLDLMLDRAFAEVELPPHEPDADWRADLQALARASQAVAERHPWMRNLVGTRTPCGPNGLRVSERMLAAVEGIGVDALTMTHMVNTVLAYVYGFTQLQLAQHAAKSDAALDRMASTAHYLVGVVSSGDFPNLARLFAETPQLTADDAFEAGLGYVLDGLAAQLPGAELTSSLPATEAATDDEAVSSGTGAETGETDQRRRGLRRRG